MSELSFILSELHFLRPFWLLLLPCLAVIWWRVRRSARKSKVPDVGLAPHLREALTLGAARSRRILPIDWVSIIVALAVTGAAGPTWTRMPDPFVAQTAPMVVVLKVTPSMTANDIAPTRLERGRQKIEDLLTLRVGARTALVAYAGTAHLVVPMTNDPSLIKPYLNGLAPPVMPQEGADATKALELARGVLEGQHAHGAVLFVLDALDRTDADKLNEAASAGLAIGVLELLPEEAPAEGFSGLAFTHVRVAPDKADLQVLERALNADYRRALNENGTQPWDDRGWMLAWPAVFLALFWFRRGWTMRWLVIGFLAFNIGHPLQARAGFADWFFTPDQQGWMAYQKKDYARAAELFADPLWKGRAQMRAGQYEVAAQTLDRLKTPEAAFAKGLAHIRNRAYRDGVRAYEECLALDPKYSACAHNLDVAKALVAYVEEARESSDTGEEGGIGADEVVYDNEANRGAETQLGDDTDSAGLLTADQWMNFVDTRTSDFLRRRFAIEAAR